MCVNVIAVSAFCGEFVIGVLRLRQFNWNICVNVIAVQRSGNHVDARHNSHEWVVVYETAKRESLIEKEYHLGALVVQVKAIAVCMNNSI